MPSRRYYREHRDRLLEQTRAWKDANPDRSRALNRESDRRVRVRRQRAERRRAQGRAWYAEHREQERERARVFRRDHPEKIREYKDRFRQRHPERAAAQSRRSTEKWRDKNADAVREAQRVAAGQRREDNPELNRDYYRDNLEKERARGREASRRRSRLKQLGLPPRRIQRVYANDRRANDRAAEAFFTRPRGSAELGRLRHEQEMPFSLPTAAQRAVIAARQRIMSREDLRIAGEHLQERLRAAKARDLTQARLAEVIAHVAERQGARLREEVSMDSVARQLRGGDPYDVEAELQRRIRQQAVERIDAEQTRRLRSASFPARLDSQAAPVVKSPMRPTGSSTPSRPNRDAERGR